MHKENCTLQVFNATVKNLVQCIYQKLIPQIGHGYTYLCMPVGMCANGMNSRLCMPMILLKGTIKNYDKVVS